MYWNPVVINSGPKPPKGDSSVPGEPIQHPVPRTDDHPTALVVKQQKAQVMSTDIMTIVGDISGNWRQTLSLLAPIPMNSVPMLQLTAHDDS